MSNLDKAARDALPESDFAVPGKRKLPIHDATHVRLAWDMVDRASGLTDAERTEARRRILRRAKELGIDTKDWQITASIAFQAMAIAMPVVEDHPNRMPFSGVLTRVDQPSDEPPGGSNSHRTLLPRAVAEAALPSLLGMAVDFTPDFDGHDKQAKIGLITAAEVVGDGIHIEGFFYANDFPEECERIRAEKDSLGFSYECQARIQDPDADIWVIDYCVFTGAAVLYKDLAAYQTTSLAAKAEKDDDMNEELKKLLEAVSTITASMDALSKDVATIKASAGAPEKLDAAAARDKVKPHADALRAAAANMEAAGIGTHATQGHVNVLRHMAASMEAEATMGNIPHIYRDHDYLSRTMEAGAAQGKPTTDPAVMQKVEALSASIADIGTQLKDLNAKAFNNAVPPERATIPANIQNLLAKANIGEGDMKDGKLSVEQVNTVLDAAGMRGTAAIEMKLKLRHAGLMPAGRA